jgi:hypothetical protein
MMMATCLGVSDDGGSADWLAVVDVSVTVP